MAPTVNDDYLKEIEKARGDLRALLFKSDRAHHMLRLAFYDAGTYDPENKRTVGPNGSTKYIKDQSVLKSAVDLCESVKKDKLLITYADLYQLAGVVAVEITGGPTIVFNPGREDSKQSPEKLERLPIDDEGTEPKTIRDLIKRLDLKENDFVALFGGLHRWDAKDQETRERFDNSYFKELKKEDQNISNKALVKDSGFFEIVKQYAEEPDKFFKDYAAAHYKLSQLGFTPPEAKSAQGDKGTAESASSDLEKLRDIITRMGLEEKDIVALSVGLNRWGTEGEWTRERFNNSYFKDLIEKKNALPSAFVKDANFVKIVEQYAKNSDEFFKDYAAAQQKLSNLGFISAEVKSVQGGKVTAESASSSSKSATWSRVRLAQGIGMAIATTVVILGYLLSRRNK